VSICVCVVCVCFSCCCCSKVVVVVVSLFCFSALLVRCFAVTNVTFASLYVGFRLPLCRICNMFLFNKIFVNYQKKIRRVKMCWNLGLSGGLVGGFVQMG
jgi:hypothetical protein